MFYNFVKNKNISKSCLNALEFSKQLKLKNITKKQVSKFFHNVRIKIKNKMHKIWKEYKLVLKPYESGKPSCEIDESKIVNYKNETRWMFGIYDRDTKEVRIFYVDNNRTKESLIPIIKNNIFSNYNNLLNNSEPNDEIFSTRIYSECFQSYQVSDFNEIGYIFIRLIIVSCLVKVISIRI